jgi:hypothetical protein
MKRKILYAAFVAAIMGTANPVYGSYENMYRYYYYENGQWVGEGRDLCTKSGVVPQAEMDWGYATNDYEAVLWGGCYEPWVPPEW